MRRLICTAIALILLAAGLCCGIAEKADGQIHNYIILIDNSRSAADPDGLRFDAARLLYENALSTAEAGARGKLGVIVFCGPKFCVGYGPTDIDEDPEFLEEQIGCHLSSEANRAQRDNYTDINTALEVARSMMLDFKGGETSLILFEHSANALTDDPDPYNQPENIKANDLTVQTIEELCQQGAALQIIALTAPEDVLGTDAFMAFVSRMAEAGGGKLLAGGNYDNVLSATRSDLTARLLQWLAPAEAEAGDGVLNAVEYTPASVPFAVSDEDAGATVAIAFMPSDRDKLGSVALVLPDGDCVLLYDEEGVYAQDGIDIEEDQNGLLLDITSLQPGEWQVEVAAQNEAKIPVNIAINLRQGATSAPQASDPDGIAAGPSEPGAEDGGSKAAGAVADKPGAEDGGSKAAGVVADKPDAIGAETGEADADASESAGISDISSEDLKKGIDELIDYAKEEGKLTIPTSAEDEDFEWQIEAEGDQIRVSWQGDELNNALAELREKSSNTLLLSGIQPEDAIALGLLEEDVEYVLLINAFSSDEEDDGTGERIAIQALDLKLIPDGGLVEGTTLNVANAVLALAPVAMNTDLDALKTAQSPQTSQGASKGANPSGGSDGSSSAPSGSAKPSGGGAGSSGAPAQSDAQGAKAAGSGTESDEKPNGAAASGAFDLSPAAIASIVWDFLKRYWMYFAAAAGLIAAVVVFAITRTGKVEKVSGNLRIECETLDMNQLFRFEKRNRIDVGATLTQYPDIAKQRGSRIYTLLSSFRVEMAHADEYGKVPGSDAQFRTDDDLIKVIYTDPRTNREQVCYVSQYDSTKHDMNVYSGGKTYDLSLSSILSFDDLLYNS